jgi:hypothetical protein
MTGHKLDLHGATWEEAQAAFIEHYNQVLSQAAGRTSQGLDVVHGYGSSGKGGVLRTKLRAFLEQQSALLEFFPGEEADGNPGHTLVVPQLPLPEQEEFLAEEVWAYCTVPRSLDKIAGKFRKQGEPQVLRAIRALESQRRLHGVRKGTVKLYQAG